MAQDVKSGSEELLLDISDLHVQYATDDATVYALNGFELKVRRGEKLGLVGETGAGKTTMALSVMGLLPEKNAKVTAGCIMFGGDNLLAQSEAYMLGLRGRCISMIFQDPMTSLNPIVSVGDQIMEVLDLHAPGMSRHEKSERVDKILSMVGIPPARKAEFPYQFSGGMKQRIVIAMALIAEPELLLADEPTTALDVTIQAQIMRLLKQLKEKMGTSIILITHDLGVVAQIAQRVMVMYCGEAVECCAAREIYKNPLHPYTSGLLASVPKLTDDDMAELPAIPGMVPSPSELPKGCRFAPRCGKCGPRCLQEKPELVELEDGHKVRCFLYEGGVGK